VTLKFSKSCGGGRRSGIERTSSKRVRPRLPGCGSLALHADDPW
jgi:hypothetical protein